MISAGRSPAPSQVGFSLVPATSPGLRGVLCAAPRSAPARSPCPASWPRAATTRRHGDTGSKEVSFGSNYSDAGAEGRHGGGVKALRDEVGQDRQDQHCRPQHVPGEHQPVPAGHAGRRLHLVRRLPDAVLRRAGPGHRHLRRLEGVGGGFTDALKEASTGEDGKQYFVPFYYYPWAVFYRKSVWQEKGYTGRRRRSTSSRRSATQMKTDGLVPIAFADKDGWPAMGTFDYLNMRINGYDFHISLMAGKESWTDSQGQGGLRHLARAAAVPPAGRQRPDLAGGRAGAAEQAGRHVRARLRSSASSSPTPSATTSTSSRSRRSTRSTARTRSRRRSTASWCRRRRRTRPAPRT